MTLSQGSFHSNQYSRGAEKKLKRSSCVFASTKSNLTPNTTNKVTPIDIQDGKLKKSLTIQLFANNCDLWTYEELVVEISFSIGDTREFKTID